MFRKIVIASDGSEGAARALSTAVHLAKAHGSELHMISVEELPQFPASVDEVIEEKAAANHFFDGVIARAKGQAQALGVKLATHIVTGHAVATIVEFVAREHADLLVIGYMGHSALYNRVIGSTTDRLVELAPSAVLVVK
ncbi:MAG: universal stress protein [Sphingomonadales bacterium]|nr:universal stress protein [Sphingomonadales bacterium]